MLPQHSDLNCWAWKYAHINITLWTYHPQVFHVDVNVFIQTSIKALRGKFLLLCASVHLQHPHPYQGGTGHERTSGFGPSGCILDAGSFIVSLAHAPQIAKPAKKGACASNACVFRTAYHYSASSGISKLQEQTTHECEKMKRKKFLRASALQDNTVSF